MLGIAEDLGEDGEGTIDVGTVNVVVGDHTDGEFVDRSGKNFVRCEGGNDFSGGAAGGANVKENDVRDDFRRIDGDAFDLRETFGKMSRVFVIAMQNFRRLRAPQALQRPGRRPGACLRREVFCRCGPAR
jgi:hypothetical protein